MISIPLPKGTKANLKTRDWGIERSHITPRGNEICTPAPYENSTKINRKFKILTSSLIELGYLDRKTTNFKVDSTRRVIDLS